MSISSYSPTATPQPQERHATWRDVGLATRPNWLQVFVVTVSVLALLGVSSCDLILIKTTLDHVLRMAARWSWLLAAALTGLAAATMLWAGHLARHAEVEGRGRSWLARPGLPVAGWAGLGAAFFTLRWAGASFVPPPAVFAGQAPAADNAQSSAHLLALVLVGVYGATGVLAALEGYHLTNPVATAVRRLRRTLDKLVRLRSESFARYERQREHLDLAVNDIRSIPGELAVARRAHRALAAELKELARVQIAFHLGDPAATGVTRMSPTGRRHPDGSP